MEELYEEALELLKSIFGEADYYAEQIKLIREFSLGKKFIWVPQLDLDGFKDGKRGFFPRRLIYKFS